MDSPIESLAYVIGPGQVWPNLLGPACPALAQTKQGLRAGLSTLGDGPIK